MLLPFTYFLFSLYFLNGFDLFFLFNFIHFLDLTLLFTNQTNSDKNWNENQHKADSDESKHRIQVVPAENVSDFDIRYEIGKPE